MNTQLILYPQSYQGYSSNLGFLGQEFLVDGTSFNTVNNSSILTGTQPSEGLTIKQVLNQQDQLAGGISVNTWYRFNSNWPGVGYVDSIAPVEASATLKMEAGGATNSVAGIFQRFSNLTPGAQYTVELNQTTSAANPPSNLAISLWNGTSYNIEYINIASVGVANSLETLNFTAVTSQDILVIWLQNPSPYNPVQTFIEYISTLSVGYSPTNIPIDLQDGQVICDLYEEENLPLSLSVDDFSNVAEQVKSYSKDFDLPATKRNNQIFNNMFEVTRNQDGIIFNPYSMSRCVLKQDGFILFEGYLRLINVKDLNGEISYNVNLYSEVTALADVLKERTIADLNFSELEHVYDKDSIKQSWDGNLPLSFALSDPNEFAGAIGATTTDVLAYPFINWTSSFLDGTQNTSATNNQPELTNLGQAFRPCIKIKYIIENIFAASQFRFTSTFFNTSEFNKLFMDFNWGADANPTTIGSFDNAVYPCQQVLIGTVATTAFTPLVLDNTGLLLFLYPSSYNDTTHKFIAPSNNFALNIDYHVRIESTDASTHSYRCRWVHVRALGGTVVYDDTGNVSLAGNTYDNFDGNITANMQINDTLQMQILASSAGVIQQGVGNLNLPGTILFVTEDIRIILNDTLVSTLRGEIGQWDFLKGIITMFNLVTLIDETDSSNILIEPYSEVFINNTNSLDQNDLSLSSRFNGMIHDWTDKVDAAEMELIPLTEINKKTTFKFAEDSDDYVFNRMTGLESGRLFGSRVWEPPGFDILSGEEEVVAEPFAATVTSALTTQYPLFVVPNIYSRDESGECESFDNAPRILYNVGKRPTGTEYFIPEQNGKGSEMQPDYLCFSHLSELPSGSSTSQDFHFQSNQLETNVGTAPANNLFSTYWLPYLNELYNPDTRIMKLKIDLSPSDIALFKFYDTVMIKNRVFRVNKIDYKPNSLANVEFILLP